MRDAPSFVIRIVRNPIALIVFGVFLLYSQFFIEGKIPIPADTLVGAYFPWLDYKWGYETGVPIKNAPISDIYSQIYPWKYLSINLIKEGSWPLWNPYSLSGSPLLANYQSAPFLPFNIFLLVPGNQGWAFFILAQTLVAAFGMYLLLREYVSGLLARMVGVVVFTLSGLMSTYIEFGIAVWAAAMLPWIFYSLLSFFKLQKTRYLLLMSFSFISLYLAGHAQLTIYGTAIFFLYLFYRSLFIKDINRKQVIQPIFFWAISSGVASIQLLPSWDIVNYSIRGSEAYLKGENYGLSPLYEAIRLISADFFGNPATVNHWDSQSYHEMSSFLGTLTLPLITPLLLKKFRNREVNFWGLLFLISLLLLFDNPVSKFIYNLKLPLFTYSAATRILFITSFSVAFLVAFAVGKLKDTEEYLVWVKRSVLLYGIVILLIFITIFLLSKEGINLFIVSNVSNLDITLKNMIPPLGILIVAFVVVSLLKVVPKKLKESLIACLVLLIFLDLGRYFIKYNPFIPDRLVFPSTPIHNFLQEQEGYFRIARADHEIMPPNTWIGYGIPSIEGYDPIALSNYASYFSRLNGDPYQGRLSRFIEVSKYPSKFLDSLNAKYILAVKRDEKGSPRGNFFNSQLQRTDYKPIFEDKNTVVLLNPQASERAYFVKTVTTVGTKEELINYLNNPGFDPTVEAVILGSQFFDKLSNNSDVTIQSYKPNEIVLRTSSEGPAFLVLSESYEQGWHLFRNQAEEVLYEVNGALRGISVLPGESEFKLVYWPNSFDMGLKISLFSLMILMLANIYFKVKRLW